MWEIKIQRSGFSLEVPSKLTPIFVVNGPKQQCSIVDIEYTTVAMILWPFSKYGRLAHRRSLASVDSCTIPRIGCVLLPDCINPSCTCLRYTLSAPQISDLSVATPRNWTLILLAGALVVIAECLAQCWKPEDLISTIRSLILSIRPT